MPELPEGCLGLFHCGTSRIDVLGRDDFEASVIRDGPFASIPIDAYYDSVVVHEMAHAATDDLHCPFAKCPVATEYIAYAMQIRSLPDTERTRFEAEAKIDPKEARSYLSAIMLWIAPQRFAAAAWTHFTHREEPCGYIAGIVGGTVVLDRALR